jgi:hypothetical protein
MQNAICKMQYTMCNMQIAISNKQMRQKGVSNLLFPKPINSLGFYSIIPYVPLQPSCFPYVLIFFFL